MFYLLYNFILTIAFVMSLPFLPLVILFGARYRDGLSQRLGFFPNTVIKTMAGSRPIWIHAASVGEVRSALPLVREFKKRWPTRKIILSTFTSTGNRVAREGSAADAVVFLPFDLWWIVRRVLGQLDPSILIIVETEIWPNLLHAAYQRGVPTLLLSGRLSPRAYQQYARFGFFFRRVLQGFTAMSMQSAEDAERMFKLGVETSRVSVGGSLKQLSGFARDGDRLRSWNRGRETAGEQYLLVVGSSHRGEEEILLKAFVSLKRSFSGLQMVLAPRHPQRFAEVERLLQTMGLLFAKKSEVDGRLKFNSDVMFLDTIGDLLDFYAVGDVAFVGGSLVNAGGHNLLEPARFGKPILFGPFTGHFSSVAAILKQRGAGIEVQGVEDLVREITALLNDSQKRWRMGEMAFEVAADDGGVMEHSMEMAARYL